MLGMWSRESCPQLTKCRLINESGTCQTPPICSIEGGFAPPTPHARYVIARTDKSDVFTVTTQLRAHGTAHLGAPTSQDLKVADHVESIARLQALLRDLPTQYPGAEDLYGRNISIIHATDPGAFVDLHRSGSAAGFGIPRPTEEQKVQFDEARLADELGVEVHDDPGFAGAGSATVMARTATERRRSMHRTWDGHAHRRRRTRLPVARQGGPSEPTMCFVESDLGITIMMRLKYGFLLKNSLPVFTSKTQSRRVAFCLSRWSSFVIFVTPPAQSVTGRNFLWDIVYNSGIFCWSLDAKYKRAIMIEAPWVPLALTKLVLTPVSTTKLNAL
ncbi:hypothetical protein OG21DRAFT_1523096 [Imleria badia]|nr:hypothetical protein OG21DRAFT_1523096 [Imleria badia]